jgi:hypothetical protein
MTANVNAPQRPSDRRGALIAVVAVAVGLLVLVALLAPRGRGQAVAPTATASTSPTTSATATATTSPTATASSTATATASAAPGTTTYQSPLGYSVQLPAGWRRSELASRTIPFPQGQGDPDLLGTELFTRLAPADEAEARRREGTGVGPALVYTANVGLYRNSRNLSAMAYAEREQASLGLISVSIEPTTVDGRAGVKSTFKFATSDPTSMYALYVPDGERMWVVRYFTAPSGMAIPAGATEAGVRSIVESFRFAR